MKQMMYLLTFKYQHLKKGRGSMPGELYEELHSVLDSLRLKKLTRSSLTKFCVILKLEERRVYIVSKITYRLKPLSLL